jgi:hypothetical protein
LGFEEVQNVIQFYDLSKRGFQVHAKLLGKNWFVFFLVMAFPLLLSPKVYAIPSAMANYVGVDLGGGFWEYDYTSTNTSNPLANAGCDVYDFSPFIDPGFILSDITNPANWDQFSDSSSFITWFSLIPGEPPSGSDIVPGTFLSGFNFKPIPG